MVQEIALYNTELQSHIDASLGNDAKYLGLKSQNKLIIVIAKKVLQNQLVAEIKATKYHTILQIHK